MEGDHARSVHVKQPQFKWSEEASREFVRLVGIDQKRGKRRRDWVAIASGMNTWLTKTGKGGSRTLSNRDCQQHYSHLIATGKAQHFKVKEYKRCHDSEADELASNSASEADEFASDSDQEVDQLKSDSDNEVDELASDDGEATNSSMSRGVLAGLWGRSSDSEGDSDEEVAKMLLGRRKRMGTASAPLIPRVIANAGNTHGSLERERRSRSPSFGPSLTRQRPTASTSQLSLARDSSVKQRDAVFQSLGRQLAREGKTKVNSSGSERAGASLVLHKARLFKVEGRGGARVAVLKKIQGNLVHIGAEI